MTAKNDIPVYLSSLIAFASSQLEALAQAEGMTSWHGLLLKACRYCSLC